MRGGQKWEESRWLEAERGGKKIGREKRKRSEAMKVELVVCAGGSQPTRQGGQREGWRKVCGKR